MDLADHVASNPPPDPDWSKPTTPLALCHHLAQLSEAFERKQYTVEAMLLRSVSAMLGQGGEQKVHFALEVHKLTLFCLNILKDKG